jgi:hypothetical protein
MPIIIFVYKDLDCEIECKANEKIKDIFKKYSEIIEKKIEEVNLIYEDIIINKDLTFEQLIENEKLNLINIRVEEIDNSNSNKIIEDINNFKDIIDNQPNKPNLEYNIKKEHKFHSPNLKYKLTITNKNNKVGLNDAFEVFTSFKDNEEYLVAKNNNNLDIYRLSDLQLYFKAKGHNSTIICVRYFFNDNDCKEYLISSDDDNNLLIWDINDNYKNIKSIHIINGGTIYSCLLIFPRKEAKTYIIASSSNHQGGIDNNSLNENQIFKSIPTSFYLLSWYNKKDFNHYIIILGSSSVVINSLKPYYKYHTFIESISVGIHNSGFIFNKNNVDYLCTSSIKGYIYIYDLYQKRITNYVKTNGCRLMHIIQWNQEYAIVADYDNKALKVIDLDSGKVVSHIQGVHSKGVICVKRVYNHIFGESLLTSGSDKTIKLWTL